MKRNIERIQRAFNLYKKLQDHCNHYVMRRGSLFGIGVCGDEYAVRWQKLQFRIHVLDCYISGDKINWYQADWLPYEEVKKRMENL